jgi:hypothetical protein
MDGVRLVIFDMDGLMFDTERLAVAAWVAAGRRFGVPVSEDDVIATIGLDGRATEAAFRARFGADMPFAEMRQFRVAHATARIEADGLPVKPGLYELLDYLEAHDIRRALATSTRHERASEYLAMAGILARFDAVLGGDQVARSKPEPTSFWPPRRRWTARRRPAWCWRIRRAACGRRRGPGCGRCWCPISGGRAPRCWPSSSASAPLSWRCVTIWPPAERRREAISVSDVRLEQLRRVVDAICWPWPTMSSDAAPISTSTAWPPRPPPWRCGAAGSRPGSGCRHVARYLCLSHRLGRLHAENSAEDGRVLLRRPAIASTTA